MLENLSQYFYDPVVFWAAPLVLVAVAAGWSRARAWGRSFSGMPAGNGDDGPSRREDGP